MKDSRLASFASFTLPPDRVIDDVEPTEDAMKHHPKNGMIDAPRNGDGEHTSEAPKTYARRPAMGFHVILRDCCSVSEQGTVYTEGPPLILRRLPDKKSSVSGWSA